MVLQRRLKYTKFQELEDETETRKTKKAKKQTEKDTSGNVEMFCVFVQI